jgi:hypothetical protein
MKVLQTIKNALKTIKKYIYARYEKAFIIPSAKKYYTSLEDLPLKNWIKINEGNYTYTRKDRNKGNKRKDFIAQTLINDSYIHKFGLSKLYLKILNLLRKKALLELDFVITGNRAKLTQIEVEEANLKSSFENKGKDVSIETTLIYISKFLNTWVNIEVITVTEYFSLVEELDKYNKEISALNKESRKNKNR